MDAGEDDSLGKAVEESRKHIPNKQTLSSHFQNHESALSEPRALVTALSSGVLSDITPGGESMTMGNAQETQRVKGMAKQLDEQDRAAKRQARPQSGRQAANAVPSKRVQRPSLTQESQKLRSTYLDTGMKPGAYPDKSPVEVDQANRQYSISHQLSNQVIENEIAVENDLEISWQEQPLVEAFVVPEEQTQSEVTSMPAPKLSTTIPVIAHGDYMDRTQPVEEKTGLLELLKNQNIFLLVGCLVCCFIIGAVVALALVMTVVNNGTSSSAAAVSVPTIDSITLIPTASPIAGVMPPTNTPITIVDPEEDYSEEDTPTTTPSIDDNELLPTQPEETIVEPDPTNTPLVQTANPSTTEPTFLPPKLPTTETPTQAPTRTTSAPTIVTSAPSKAPTTMALTTSPEEATTEPTEAAMATNSPTAATIPTELPTSAPSGLTAFDSAATTRVSFTIIYTIDEDDIPPSQEEQLALDRALVGFFTDSLETAVSLERHQLVSSEHKSHSQGWWQLVVVDFLFEGDDLPPLDTVVDALSNSNMNLYLSSVSQSIGPSFSSTTAVEFQFNISEYGG